MTGSDCARRTEAREEFVSIWRHSVSPHGGVQVWVPDVGFRCRPVQNWDAGAGLQVRGEGAGAGHGMWGAAKISGRGCSLPPTL